MTGAELPENVTIVRLHRTFYPGERNVNATQVNGLDSLHAEGITDAELKLPGANPSDRGVPAEVCAGL